MENREMQLNIGICDDEPSVLNILRDLCTDTLGASFRLHIDCACTAAELLSMERPFHIALLDVQLLEENGIELARKILEINPKCRIIFVSGYLHAVSEVYDVPHFCFVPKAFLSEQLPRFLLRAAALAAKEAGRKIMIACGRKMEEVPLSEIVTLERKGHTTTVKLLSGDQYQTREKLQELLLRIRDEDFIRCHVSFAVNLQNTAALNGASFTMDTGEIVPISRPNEGPCREAFFRHLGEIME